MSSCWTLRAYKVRKLRLTDYERLPSVPVARSETPVPFVAVTNLAAYQSLRQRLDSFSENTETAAFLVIRNDSLIYERYAMGFTENALLPSNSMAKSFVGTLVGMALAEGTIRSDQEPITRYLPELEQRDARFTAITIQHLLDMRSGLHFREGSYTLKDDAVRLGFRRNLRKHLLKARIAEAPGRYQYQSINTQLLGMILERATGTRLQEYLQEKLWKPMGTENSATWNVDSRKRKQVITSAGLNATARDFAKLGRLYLNKGCLNGVPVLDSGWIATIASADTMEKYGGYKFQWRNRKLRRPFGDSLEAAAHAGERNHSAVFKERDRYVATYRSEAYSATGFMNQILYIHPKKNLIIVRLGRRWTGPSRFTQTIYQLGEDL